MICDWPHDGLHFHTKARHINLPFHTNDQKDTLISKWPHDGPYLSILTQDTSTSPYVPTVKMAAEFASSQIMNLAFLYEGKTHNFTPPYQRSK